MTSETKEFPLEQVLTCTHDKVLIMPVGKIYEFLNWFFDDVFFTHQLGLASRKAKTIIEKEHPFLSEISVDHINPDNWQDEVEKLKARYGEWLTVTSAPGQYEGGAFQDLDTILNG